MAGDCAKVCLSLRMMVMVIENDDDDDDDDHIDDNDNDYDNDNHIENDFELCCGGVPLCGVCASHILPTLLP